jgi:hypothetical protein
MTRIVKIQISDEDINEIVKSINSAKELYSAIGYLSTWNFEHQEVVIYRDTNSTDLVAHYYAKISDPYAAYTIGAVWHNDKYTFHS